VVKKEVSEEVNKEDRQRTSRVTSRRLRNQKGRGTR
jgi:hypothetical protein